MSAALEPLTPMLVQYLVGLCCLKANPDAVDVILGDFVEDHAAHKARDVDVTVTLREADGSLRAFKAFEVKKESRSLDVAAVEQLIIKLMDMPSVTHRSIVSSSGFTPAAIAKAGAHGVELYAFQPWQPADGLSMPSFSTGALPVEIQAWHRALLCWSEQKLWLSVPGGPASFTWTMTDPVFDANGQPHSRFASAGAFANQLFLESTEILLWALSPGKAALPVLATPLRVGELRRHRLENQHSHTIDVSQHGVYFNFEAGKKQILSASIDGALEWQISLALPQFYIVEKIPDRAPFAGAAIAETGGRSGHMCALTFTPGSRSIGVHPNVVLREEHRNMIRELALRSGGITN
jgi:hypothetical protein